METKKKVQIFVRTDQKAALKSIAARTGQKQSDLIREGIDLVIEKKKEAEPDWRKAILSGAGMWKDRTDLDELSREFRESADRRLDDLFKPSRC